jgi:hypothetical protein
MIDLDDSIMITEYDNWAARKIIPLPEFVRF